jgi:glycosyltransferase involved in cell wall biosynthesis
MSLRILVLEPYYDGSHRAFIEGLCTTLPFEFHLLTLPARKWKWRMRLSAPFFAEKLKSSGKEYDRILCSSFVDVAAFRGLAPEWVKRVPVLTYFHENQFAYPVQVNDERDFHFGLTNMTTALASDRIAFNSKYNLSTFVEGIRSTLKHSYDMKLYEIVDTVQNKAAILPPGVDFSLIDSTEPDGQKGPPVILWNHRWEHDKNPEEFFHALIELANEGIELRLIVLGESFRERPEIFETAKRRLGDRILHFGFTESRRDYARLLKRSDIVISTANHEFFGISVIEAVRAGCRPLLPRRLSYPELFPDQYLYEDGQFTERLKRELLNHKKISGSSIIELTAPYSWPNLRKRYESWLLSS